MEGKYLLGKAVFDSQPNQTMHMPSMALNGSYLCCSLGETTQARGRHSPRKQATSQILWLIPLTCPIDVQSLNSLSASVDFLQNL